MTICKQFLESLVISAVFPFTKMNTSFKRKLQNTVTESVPWLFARLVDQSYEVKNMGLLT